MRAHFVCVSGASTAPDADIRLLGHGLADDPSGRGPVTVRQALEAAGLDPRTAARRLVTLPPDIARDDLAAILRGFRIAGHPCPDPDAFAMAALSRAGAEFLPHPFASARFHLLTAALALGAAIILAI